MTDTLLTVKDVAKKLRVSERSVREMCRNRTRQSTAKPIPIVRLNPKCVRFSRFAIDNWIEELQKEGVQQ
jgi:predicted DNA-binding transcriptional regulator AlpA